MGTSRDLEAARVGVDAAFENLFPTMSDDNS
jgi:hypothetical protein